MRCDGQTLTLMGIMMCQALVLFVSAKKQWPPGLNSKMIPAPTFDNDAPICNPTEACGFYSFTLKSRSLRWIKSWCRCSEDQQCVYDKTDTKMRVYRQSCISRVDYESAEEEPEAEAEVEEGRLDQNQEQLAQEHQHLLAARSRRALQFLRSLNTN